MKSKILFILCLWVSFSYSQSDTLKPDYRNHKNIPAYDKSLMPMSSSVGSSSGVWTELNPRVPRVDYLGIDFVGTDTGWAVGASGAIIRTLNGGETWEWMQSGTTNVLLNVDSYDGKTVIATGYDGIILRSTNSGKDWVTITSGTTSNLWRVQMINDTLGWICGTGSVLLRTTNGGNNWSSVSTGFPSAYWSLSFCNERIGIIGCGLGKVLKTTDGGITWNQKNTGTDYSIYSIYTLNENVLFAGGFSTIIRSTDGGSNWTTQFVSGSIYSIAFFDNNNGLITGDYWTCKTTDQGNTWQLITGIVSQLNWIGFIDSTTAFCCGDNLSVLKSQSSLTNWKQLIINDDFSDVFFTDPVNGFVISWKGLYKTTDAGMTWIKQINSPRGRSVYFTDNNTGYIGSASEGTYYKIHRTTDHGNSWNTVLYDSLIGEISKISRRQDNTLWALGSGRIAQSTDDGISWSIKGPGGTSFYFIDSLTGWITRFNGRPFKTIDGGNTWVEQTNLTELWHTNDIYFLDSLKGWLINTTSGNYLYKTTDGGINWLFLPDVLGVSHFKYFPNRYHWLINGSSRYETRDSGNTWQNISANVPTGFNSFHAPSEGRGYAVGYLGLILNYIDSIYVPVEISSFKIILVENRINLVWQTETERNNYGFYILRKQSNTDWEAIGFVGGMGTTTERKIYEFIDNDIPNNQVYYRLKQIDYTGLCNYSSILDFTPVQKSFQLLQNYPNPANPTTTIRFTIPQNARVMIEVYTSTGEHLEDIYNQEADIGTYMIELNFKKLSSGIYFIGMKTDTGFRVIKKIIVLK